MLNYNSNSSTTKTPTRCPRCASTNFIRQTGLDEETSHYGRLKCGDCGRFLQWLRDPSTTLTTMQRQKAIEQILQCHKSKLSQKDIKFLQSMHSKRFLTERQQKYLNSLGLQCIGINICAPAVPSSNQQTKPRA
jgi:transposase-like protein